MRSVRVAGTRVRETPSDKGMKLTIRGILGGSRHVWLGIIESRLAAYSQGFDGRVGGLGATCRADHTTMGLKRSLAVAALLVGESIAFLLALLAVMRSLGDASLPLWLIVAIVGAVYLVIGALPVPRARHPLVVGISAFLVPLVILGWIGWRTEYFLLFKHVRAWENAPRVILAPANLGTALFLSSCAIVGHVLARRIRRHAS